MVELPIYFSDYSEGNEHEQFSVPLGVAEEG